MLSAEVEDLWERQGKKPQSYSFVRWGKAVKRCQEKGIWKKPISERVQRIMEKLKEYEVKDESK